MTKKFANDFPILSQYTYANTAASGLLSEGLMDWRQEHDIDFLIGGSIFRETQEKFINGVRKSVANFFNASKENTVLVPNFSFGWNTLLEGLPKNKKFLLLQEDYPSVNFPIESKGFKVCYAQINEALENNIIETIKKEKPDIFAFSVVQYISGIKMRLSFINQLKKDFPDLLIFADGTQFCGTEKFDFAASGIDVLGASGYKWMLAGYGNGFMMFKDGVSDLLYTEAKQHEPHKESFLKEKGHLKIHFEPGHLDTLNFGSLQFAINFLSEVGMDEIQNQLTILKQKAVIEFKRIGVLDETVNEETHSTIFNLKGDMQMLEKLREKDIICSSRGGGIRISFHFYNTEKEVNKLALAIRDLQKTN
ncbi:aminotransferase class V-fold PLP-dependent enzyme [Zhouia sp. PK063]|uniref:aminotransferase class V-fold PLP-dependent enzyme n=1 Tax=Zhouia sp. PK063 TaxID=3373602 RepID=UPI00379538CA